MWIMVNHIKIKS